MGAVLFEYSHFTATGNRSENQDRLLVLADDAKGEYLFAVADGMGGHRAGAEAAQAAISTLESCWTKRGTWQNPPDRIQGMILRCHRAVLALAETSEMSPPGTTLAVLLVSSELAWSGHVGDTRVMHYSSAGLEDRTRDHSATEQKLVAGSISEEEAATDPDLNRVTQVLGGQETPQPSLKSWCLEEGDLMCLASDGAWSLLTDDDFRVMRASRQLRPALGQLMASRLSGAPGGQDNATLILLRK